MLKKSEIEIIGIDPAPSKPSIVFDGNSFYSFKADCLLKYIREKEETNREVLICWDAPLSGPDVNGGKFFSGSYSDRPVEKALRSLITKVQGVSVLPYGGCSHWTISRAAFGYPIVSEFDTFEKDLPFKKLRSKTDRGKLLVEVHPALSMYFWSTKKFKKYKGSGRTKIQKQEAIKNNFKAVKDELESSLAIKFPNIFTDDQLDAFVAYLMGYLWVHQNDKVQLFGNEDKGGAMLLPNKAEIIEKVDDKLNKLLTP